MGEWVVLFFLLGKFQNITIAVNWQENQQNLECFHSIGCCTTTCQMGNVSALCFWKSQNITISVNWQENQQNLECFRSIRCRISSCQMGNGWVGCALLSFWNISKYYNLCKLTREPTESGMLPLNWLLFKYLPNGNCWVGCALVFFFKIAKNTIPANSQEHQVILECFRSIGCWITTWQMRSVNFIFCQKMEVNLWNNCIRLVNMHISSGMLLSFNFSYSESLLRVKLRKGKETGERGKRQTILYFSHFGFVHCW